MTMENATLKQHRQYSEGNIKGFSLVVCVLLDFLSGVLPCWHSTVNKHWLSVLPFLKYLPKTSASTVKR